MGYDAGYDQRAMDILMQRLLLLQKKSYLVRHQHYNEHDIIPSSHPVGEKRIQFVKLLVSGSKEGSLNPSGKERFEQIKRFAEFEYLKLLDESFDIHNMITYPLKRYLLTGEDVYLPTLIRGIRKAMLLNGGIKRQGFMTTHFAEQNRFQKRENIIHHLFFEYPDSTTVKLMHERKAIDFDEVPFYTFEQAFKYFTTVAIAAGYQEPLLDEALHFGIKSAKGKKAINNYLADKNNLYWDYAKKLKSKKLLEDIKEGRKLVLYGGLNSHFYKKSWLYHDYYGGFKNRHRSLGSLRSRYIEDELEYEVHNYVDFVQANLLGVHMSTIEQLIYSGNGGKMMEFDPRLFYALTKENIKSIEFLRMDNLKIRGRRLSYLLLLPPFTPYTIYYILAHPILFSKNLNYASYYRLDNDGKELQYKTSYSLKVGAMNEKRSERVVYKLHRNARRGYGLFLGIFRVNKH